MLSVDYKLPKEKSALKGKKKKGGIKKKIQGQTRGPIKVKTDFLFAFFFFATSANRI